MTSEEHLQDQSQFDGNWQASHFRSGIFFQSCCGWHSGTGCSRQDCNAIWGGPLPTFTVDRRVCHSLGCSWQVGLMGTGKPATSAVAFSSNHVVGGTRRQDWNGIWGGPLPTFTVDRRVCHSLGCSWQQSASCPKWLRSLCGIDAVHLFAGAICPARLWPGKGFSCLDGNCWESSCAGAMPQQK